MHITPKIDSKETSNLIKKWAKDPNRQLTQEDTQTGNKHVEAPHPVSSGKYRLKQQQDITAHLLEWLKSEDLTTANAGAGVEQYSSRHCWWDCRMVHSAFKCFKKSMLVKCA